VSAYIEAPAESSAVPPHTGTARRPRRALWVRPTYWGTLALAALVYCCGLGQNGNANSYYAAAVLSGTKSWSAMFYGSLDAGNFITVDKPPFALWLMEISCRLFGFGSWQMLLPIAACGVASVAVLYSAVRRSFGPLAGTVSALVLALTPITVAINRDNNPDPVLVLLTVAAAWFCLEAIRRGTLRHLVISAVLVGFAFNTKMLQAYMVLPALFLAYVWARRGSWLVRTRNLLIAGVALVVSSGWWMVIVDSIKDHPFIGSSSDGTVWNLVIGYNGLERVLGSGAGTGGGGAGGGGANFGGASGAGRLFNDILGGQISWLIPFAVIALVGALVLRGRRRRTDPQRASLLLWGMWLLTHYVVFSFSSGTFHPYYTTMLAPAIAALTGAGGTMLLRALRSPSRKPLWAAVLPAGVVVSALWAVLLLRRTSGFAPWLWPAVALLAAGGVAALLVARFGASSIAAAVRSRVLAVGAAAAALALVAGPAAYAADTATSDAIQGTNPTAGPSSGEGFGGPGGVLRGGFPGGLRGGFPGGLRGGEFPPGVDGAGSVGPTGGVGGGFPGGASAGSAGTGGTGVPGIQGGSSGAFGSSGSSGSSGLSGQGGVPGGLPGGMPGGTSGGSATGGTTQGGTQPGTAPGLERGGGTNGTRGFGGAGAFGSPMGGGSVSSALLSYLEKNQGSATWLVAVSSAQSASELILESGKPVIAMGGFTGSDPAMSLAKMKSLVASGRLRYVLLGSGGFGGGPGGGQANSEATNYVKSTCKAVSASAYGGTASTGTSSSSASSAGTASTGSTSSRSSSGETLYECTA
jgi:4-amino-4-deoxy-L-arabinose transferase-like glycosyltransferase